MIGDQSISIILINQRSTGESTSCARFAVKTLAALVGPTPISPERHLLYQFVPICEPNVYFFLRHVQIFKEFSVLLPPQHKVVRQTDCFTTAPPRGPRAVQGPTFSLFARSFLVARDIQVLLLPAFPVVTLICNGLSVYC